MKSAKDLDEKNRKKLKKKWGEKNESHLFLMDEKYIEKKWRNVHLMWLFLECLV